MRVVCSQRNIFSEFRLASEVALAPPREFCQGGGRGGGVPCRGARWAEPPEIFEKLRCFSVL